MLQKMKSRMGGGQLLSCLLAVAFGTLAVLALAPAMALADTGNPEAEINGTSYPTVQDAVDAVQDGQTVTLLRDVDLTATVSTKPDTPSFTLDLKGRTLSSPRFGTAIVHQSKNNELTIADSSPDGSGAVNGTYEQVITNEPSSVITVSGGTIDGIYAVGIHSESGLVTVSGGTVVGKTKGIVSINGGVEILGGTVGGYGSDGIAIETNVGMVNVRGTGPSIIKGAKQAMSWNPTLGDGVLGQASATYDGADPEPFDAGKWRSYKYLRFGTPEAEADGTKYASVQWAVDAVGDGGTVTLLKDVDMGASTVTVESGAPDFTFDLNGKKLSGAGGPDPFLIAHKGSGTLTIKDSGSGGTVSSTDTAIENVGSGTVSLLSGTVSSSNSGSGAHAIRNYSTGTVSVSGGTVSSARTAINNWSTGTVTVSGGMVRGAAWGILNQDTSIAVISGGTVDAFGIDGKGVEGSSGAIKIKGPSCIIKGADKAMTSHPVLDDGIWGQTSRYYDGSDLKPYDPDYHIDDYKYFTSTSIVDVGFTGLSADGEKRHATTTTLTLAFDQEVPGLSLDDVAVSGATGTALAPHGGATTSYDLSVEGIGQDGDQVTVAVGKDGYTFTPSSKVVSVHKEVELDGAVEITGTPRVDEELTATATTNNTGDLSYQWKRGTADISGENDSTYVVTVDDVGKKLSCAVTSSVETGSVGSNPFGPVGKKIGPEAPNVSFSFDGPNAGRLMGATDKMEYSLDAGATWNDCTADMLLPGTITEAFGIRARVKETEASEAGEPRIIAITKESPVSGVTVQGCTSESNDDGRIFGVNSSMEYSSDRGATWQPVTSAPIKNLVPGVYLVRMKAHGTFLPGEASDLTVAPFVPVRDFAFDLSGTLSFPDAAEGYTTEPKTVRISNAGNLPTGTLHLFLSGPQAASFRLSTETIPSIAAGGAAEFSLGPVADLAAGTYAATVTVRTEGASGRDVHSRGLDTRTVDARDASGQGAVEKSFDVVFRVSAQPGDSGAGGGSARGGSDVKLLPNSGDPVPALPLAALAALGATAALVARKRTRPRA